MSGTATMIWIMVVVIVVVLAVWLGLVRYAAEHPGRLPRRRERMRGNVQGGQHLGGGRSVMPHRDAPVPEGGGISGTEDSDADQSGERQADQASRRGSGNPMDL